MRLDKLLSDSGLGTRADIKKLIRSRKVTVNGECINDPGFHAELTDDIVVNGQKISAREKLYFMFDKPDEVLTAMEDKRLPTVGEFIPKHLTGKKISPVGRLDYHTTGLLILTNDGELSHRLTSPKYNIPKVYHVTYSGDPLTEEHVGILSKGLTLTDTDEEITLKPSELKLIDDHQCLITLYEGKTHEVRRVIAHFGRSVEALRRIKIGNLSLPEESAPGSLIELTEAQISDLRLITGLI